MNRLPSGIEYIPMCLSHSDQLDLLDDIRAVVKKAPLYTPTMPKTGKALSVRMTNCGSLGWLTDQENGYRYQKNHPQTGKPWPKIPDKLISLWREYTHYTDQPEACLINYYQTDAKMGLHQDKDEDNLKAPVMSISLGDDCLFRIGGEERGDRTQSIRLQSGDIIIMGGDGRLNFHGVDRIYPNTSTLLKDGGRINLTLRRVTLPV